MLIPALLSSVILAQADFKVARLETLPNGARVFVQRMPNVSQCSVQLWLSAAGMEEGPATHGLRHLLEHLMALGPTADLDKRLEAKGLMILASTTRDATTFKIDCPPEQVEFAIASLSEVLKSLAVSEQIVQREAKIVLHELALRPNSGCASAATWAEAFGTASLDPAGDPKVLRNATLNEVSTVQKELTQPKRLLLVITGPIEVDKSVLAGQNSLASLAAGETPFKKAPGDGKAFVPEFTGTALGVRVEGLPSKTALAKVGVAMALAQKLGDVSVSYTPSTRPGVVVLSSTRAGLAERVRGLQVGYIAGGGTAVFRWMNALKSSPSGMAALRGSLLCGPTPVNLEQVDAAIAEIGTSELLAAIHEFKEAAEVTP